MICAYAMIHQPDSERSHLWQRGSSQAGEHKILKDPDHRWASSSGIHRCAHIKVKSWTVRTVIPVQRGPWISRFQWHMQHPSVEWWIALLLYTCNWSEIIVLAVLLGGIYLKPPLSLGTSLTWPIHHLFLTAPSCAQAIHQDQTLRQGRGKERR